MSQSQEQGRIKVHNALMENELSTQLKKKNPFNYWFFQCVILAYTIIGELGTRFQNAVNQNISTNCFD